MIVDMKNMNIEDYLLWRGDYTFAQEPFNPIDAVVFAELAYVNFAPAGLLDYGQKTMTLNEAGKKIMELDAYELKTLNQIIGEYQPSAVFDKTLFDVIVKRIEVTDNVTITFKLLGDIELSEKISEKARCKQREQKDNPVRV